MESGVLQQDVGAISPDDERRATEQLNLEHRCRIRIGVARQDIAANIAESLVASYQDIRIDRA